MKPTLLTYYEAIEHSSQHMLDAARVGDWKHVVRLESICVALISQLKHVARSQSLCPEDTQIKSRIMQRILINDAEIRRIVEPCLARLEEIHGRTVQMLH